MQIYIRVIKAKKRISPQKHANEAFSFIIFKLPFANCLKIIIKKNIRDLRFTRSSFHRRRRRPLSVSKMNNSWPTLRNLFHEPIVRFHVFASRASWPVASTRYKWGTNCQRLIQRKPTPQVCRQLPNNTAHEKQISFFFTLNYKIPSFTLVVLASRWLNRQW